MLRWLRAAATIELPSLMALPQNCLPTATSSSPAWKGGRRVLFIKTTGRSRARKHRGGLLVGVAVRTCGWASQSPTYRLPLPVVQSCTAASMHPHPHPRLQPCSQHAVCHSHASPARKAHTHDTRAAPHLPLLLHGLGGELDLGADGVPLEPGSKMTGWPGNEEGGLSGAKVPAANRKTQTR